MGNRDAPRLTAAPTARLARWLALGLAALVLLAPRAATALDRQRRGFLFGFGLGPGYSTVGFDDQTRRRAGFGASLQVGYAPTDDYALMLFGGDVLGFDGEGLTMSVEAGFGARVWMRARAPSAFLSIGAGIAGWFVGDDHDVTGGGIGLCGLLGGGYELAPRWSVEILGFASRGTSDASGLLLTVGWLGY
jgi:hypothetical protein